MNILGRFLAPIRWAFGSRIRAIVTIILIGIIGFFGYRNFATSKQQVQYQTAQAQNGTLITSVQASGTISSGNSVNITTQASGVVTSLYVKNGDTVERGQKIADLALDQDSQQKLAAANANILQARASLDSAQNQLNTLQNTEFTTNQKLINDAVARGLETTDPTYIEENAAWKAAEQAYINQQTVIAQAQASLTSASMAYQQISPTITAPASGTLSNLILAVGVPVIVSSSSNSNSSSNSGSLGTISVNQGQLQAVVNLSEIDVTQVQVGQKATLTLDAFPDKTFTGSVAAIDTAGTVSSGVTTYPTTITMDSALNNIYPNMGVNATIITKVKTDVLTVPSAAVQTANGTSTVRVMRNNQPQSVDVTVGDSNDTETEITSGLNPGDTVITGQTGGSATRTGATTSPFGGGLRFGGGGGGAVIRGGAGGGRGG